MKNDLLSNIASNTLTALGGLSGDANVAIAAAVLSPVVVAATNDVASRVLSSTQSDRLNRALALIRNKCKIRRDRGDNYRNDAFMTENGGEQAKQVLEGILLNINNEYEKKKVEYHANLFTNICFEERLIFEQAIAVSRIIERLSYRQLVLISICNDSPLAVGGWHRKFKDLGTPILRNYADLYSEIQNLEQIRIIEDSSMGVSLSGSSAPLRLSLLGQTIFDELDLASVPAEDKKLVVQLISNVNNA